MTSINGLTSPEVGHFWYYTGRPFYEPGMVRAERNLRASLVPPPPTNDEHFWNVEADIKLAHFSDGAGRKVLVVHGGPGFPFLKPAPGLHPLATSCELIYYAQRGCGDSTRPFDRFSSSNYFANMQTLEKTLGLGAQIADIERIRQILGEDKLVILGHSFGGFLAALYAAEFPERVKALVLVAPANVLRLPASGEDLFAATRTLLPSAMQPEYDQYLKEYLDFGSLFTRSEAQLAALNAGFAKYYAGAAKARGFAVTPESDTREVGGWMVPAMYISMGRRHDYRSALRSVSAPVLVLHGDRDLQSEGASHIYAESFPNAQFQVIKDSGHFLFNDQPQEFAAAVTEFLGKIP